MDLLMDFLESEQVEMLKNDIKLTAIGEREFLPARVRNQLESVETATANCKGMSLVLAVSYDGRRDIVRAVQKLTMEASKGEILPADIDEVKVMRALSTSHLPDVDLLIRTSGELRLSGFLPLEACYAELYFVDKLWPDFQERDLEEAIADFERRQRRFGLLSDQATAAPA
jgi:undecaprenyl diphosphate synthase